MTIELTPAFLDRLRGLAQNCQPPIWQLNEHSDVVSVAHTVAECGFDKDAQFIAEANPATVLAMLDEIERLRAGLKPACPHWQMSEDGPNDWIRGCTLENYQTPDGGEPSEFCPDCGGSIEIQEFQPNNENEAGQ